MMIRPLAPLLFSAAVPLAAATMEEGLAFKHAQRLPEASKVFAELVAANPQDVDAIEQLATVTSWMGNHAEALPLWDRAIALAPHYHGLQISRARLLYWMGYLDQAQAALDRYVIALDAPSGRDFEAWILVGDVYRARHLNAKAYAAYQQAVAINPEWQQVQTKLRQLTPTYRWRVDAGGMFDNFDSDAEAAQRNHEQTAYLQAGYQVSETLTIAGGTDYAHEFGAVDWRWNVEAYWTVDQEWVGHGRLATTPDADVLARWEALLGVDWRRFQGVTPLLSVRTADYRDEQIVSYMPGIRIGRVFTAEARFFYTVSDVNDSTMAGSLRFAATFAEHWHPYVLGSYGEENQPPIGVAQTATGAAGVVVGITSNVSVRLDGLYEWREDIHTRVSLGGGVTVRF